MPRWRARAPASPLRRASRGRPAAGPAAARGPRSRRRLAAARPRAIAARRRDRLARRARARRGARRARRSARCGSPRSTRAPCAPGRARGRRSRGDRRSLPRDGATRASGVELETPRGRVLVDAPYGTDGGSGRRRRVAAAGALAEPPTLAGRGACARAGSRLVLSASGSSRPASARGGVAGRVDAVRERAERALGRGMPEREAALARGFVLGQDDRIDPATREDFRRSGLAHLLAVSGPERDPALPARLAVAGAARADAAGAAARAARR